MKAILVNYNFTPNWLKDSGLDYLIYDRSDGDNYLQDFPQDRIIKTENIGNVDYDKLSFLVDNYDTLPDVFIWGKTNLFKYITPQEFEAVKDNNQFTPLLTQNHRTYSDRNGRVCYYEGNMYHERNDSWYLREHYGKYFFNYKEFAQAFNLPNPQYLAFPPGGNFILTRERVHRYAREYYDDMRQLLPYSTEPGEAQILERTYYSLWK